MAISGQKAAATPGVELVAARLLRMGSVSSALLIAIGLAATLFSLTEALSVSVITAGLIILVCTPILRVVGSLWVFVREGDLLYTLFCCIVLLALMGGLWMGSTH